jgi:hypothetical protein
MALAASSGVHAASGKDEQWSKTAGWVRGIIVQTDNAILDDRTGQVSKNKAASVVRAGWATWVASSRDERCACSRPGLEGDTSREDCLGDSSRQIALQIAANHVS